MTIAKVQIDLNAELASGLTMVPLSDVFGTINPGHMVRVFEPEDGVEGDALVERIDRVRGYAYVRVNWRSIHDVATVRVPRFSLVASEASAMTAVVTQTRNWGSAFWSMASVKDSNPLSQVRFKCV